MTKSPECFKGYRVLKKCEPLQTESEHSGGVQISSIWDIDFKFARINQDKQQSCNPKLEFRSQETQHNWSLHRIDLSENLKKVKWNNFYDLTHVHNSHLFNKKSIISNIYSVSFHTFVKEMLCKKKSGNETHGNWIKIVKNI